MALTSPRFVSNARLRRAAENNPPLRSGDPDRTAVAIVQQTLADLGLALPRSTRPDGSMDGIYGPETVAAVQKFQRQHRLVDARGIADGVAGRNVLGKLDQVAPPELTNRTIFYDVPLIPQPNETSCWAAAMAMLVSFERQRRTPQEIADAASMDLNSSYGWDVLHAARRHWGLQEIQMTPPINGFPNLLDEHGPLWMVVTGNPSHAVVLTGTDGHRYSWNDPSPPNVGTRAFLQSATSLAARFGGAVSQIGANCQLLYRL